MTHNPNSQSFQRSQSEDFNNDGSTSGPGSASFQRRTVESARQFRDSLSNVIREIEPLVESARNVARVQDVIAISSLLNRSQSDATISRPNTTQDSFVINVDINEPTGGEHAAGGGAGNLHVHAANMLNNPSNNNANNNNPENDNQVNVQTVLQTQLFLKDLLKYVPFVLILLAKAFYDYHESLFIVFMLFLTFVHANSTVKKEATKQEKRSLSALFTELVYIYVCLFFIKYFFEDTLHYFTVVFNLVLIRAFTHPLTVWNLLWIVMITDFILKLITITVKILLTMLPGCVVKHKKRGKLYLFIESTSQLYRSIVAIHPWLYYLLECYQGPEKIVAVFLSAFYMISKGTALLGKVKLFKAAFLKVFQNVSIGTSPSKDQLQSAGEHCPICHDDYNCPVLLECRHIFCETCVTIWFDREQTCPLCRAKIVDDPSWRDGSTSFFLQLF